MKKLMLLISLFFVLAACGPRPTAEAPEPGMGGDGMMGRHHAKIPDEYAGMKNPVTADAASLERGQALYTTHCASCHGDGGMGDGPAGSALQPAPAPVAHTSQMMADDYLFWRISEGGAGFTTSMPGWKVLDEQARWDLVNYMRALGAGTIEPQAGMGGAAYDPETQAQRQAELLAKAVEQGVVTEAEAEVFTRVHDAVEQYRLEHPEVVSNEPDANAREAAILAALVEAGTISTADAEAFNDIHDRLGEAGLMP